MQKCKMNTHDCRHGSTPHCVFKLQLLTKPKSMESSEVHGKAQDFEGNIFIAVAENVTSENILIFVFNPLWLFNNIPYIFAALIN